MSWYKATVNHDRINARAVVFLEDTPDVAMRVRLGYLEPADEPDWHRRQSEVQRQRDNQPDDRG